MCRYRQIGSEISSSSRTAEGDFADFDTYESNTTETCSTAEGIGAIQGGLLASRSVGPPSFSAASHRAHISLHSNTYTFHFSYSPRGTGVTGGAASFTVWL